MAAEHYNDNFSLYQRVEAGSRAFERWFRIASNNVEYLSPSDETILYDTFETDKYFALYWQQFTAAVMADEPRNMNVNFSAIETDKRASDACDCDELPYELLEEQD